MVSIKMMNVILVGIMAIFQRCVYGYRPFDATLAAALWDDPFCSLVGGSIFYLWMLIGSCSIGLIFPDLVAVYDKVE